MPFMDTLCYYTLVVVGAACFLILVAFALITVITLIHDAIVEKQKSKKMYIIEYAEFGLLFKTMVFAYSTEKALKKFKRRMKPPYTIIDIKERNQ